jgi:hypothetical protein
LTGTVTPERAFWLVFGGPVEFRRTDLTCNESRTARNLERFPCEGVIWGETLDARLVLVFKEATPTVMNEYPRWTVHELGHAFSHAAGKQPEGEVPDHFLERQIFAGPLNDWQFSTASISSEVFADMFLAWVFDAWGDSSQGKDWMQRQLPPWIFLAIQNNFAKEQGLP